VLIARRANLQTALHHFGLTWFVPSVWRYRKPLATEQAERHEADGDERQGRVAAVDQHLVDGDLEEDRGHRADRAPRQPPDRAPPFRPDLVRPLGLALPQAATRPTATSVRVE
jgi:hypothetical protein